MTDTDPRALAHRMHAAFNQRDVDAADGIFAPDFHSHPLDGGRDRVKTSWTAMITACPAARSVIEDVLVDGDRAALRSTIYGLSADDPDAVAGTIVEIIRVADGRIVELWGASTIARQPR